MFNLSRSFAAASALAVMLSLSATAAQASPVIKGSFGFAVLNLTAYDSSNNLTTDLANATSFVLGGSVITGGGTGDFASFGGGTPSPLPGCI